MDYGMIAAMGYRRVPFAPDEWYHCFSRGIDKRTIFEAPEQFERFTQLLYLANDENRIERDNFYHLSPSQILQLPRNKPLVAIGAYCLMPNHYHLLLQEKVEGGISKFMHKVGTGYTTFFNQKHDRIGNLMVKPFRSKHISNDRYFKRVAQYIHLNPIELFEPAWKKGRVKNSKMLQEKLVAYKNSSLPDYVGIQRIEKGILDKKSIDLIGSGLPPLQDILTDMAAYYAQIESEF